MRGNPFGAGAVLAAAVLLVGAAVYGIWWTLNAIGVW